MKKILTSIVLLFVVLVSAAANDIVSLTFNRTGTDVASVTVNSSSTDVTAQLVNLTGATTSFKGTTGSYLTNAVLCPDMNASASSAARVLTFKVDGLSGIAQIGVTILGLNGTGGYQNQGGPERSWNISCAASSSVDGTPTVLATFNKNVTVGSGESKFELMATELDAIYRANEGESIYLTLTITPTTTNGCFFGLSEVRLMALAVEPEPEPEPEPEEVVHTFSADKVYYIQWKNTGANYITENRDKSIVVADKKNSKYQFWRLIPVEGKSHTYYIKNEVTGNYIGSCNKSTGSSSRVSTSADAQEYYIGATAGSGNIAGCHYFSSTDCENYSNELAGPRALNKDGASSNIIVWTAGLQDGSTTNYNEGSYWKIVETTDVYQAPEPPAHTTQTKNLVVYFRPCGMVGNTYLTAATIDGVDPVAYTATAAPSSFYVPYSKDHGAVMRGSTFNVSITLNSNSDADLKANAYFDWNADGEFETVVPISLVARTTTATAEVTVPEDAVSGDTRMRIRLNSNGLDRADDDVEGFVYDIPFAVVGGERKVLVDVNDTHSGTATLSSTGEAYAVGAQLTATATPKGNAEFDSWREGGVVVSREAAYTFAVANRNMTLKAYFTENTEPEATPAQWDFTFNRTSDTEATVAVTRDGVAVEGVTATIAIAPVDTYVTAERLAGVNSTGYANGTGILSINRNTDGATEDNPNKYTLTISNTNEEAFAFSYVEIYGVGVTGGGIWQTAAAPRKRYFKVKHGDTTLEPRIVSINDAQHCNGTETVNGFAADNMVVPAGATYTIELDIYKPTSGISAEEAKGCFYGLTKIALGAVPNYAVEVEGTEEAAAGVVYNETTYADGATLNATLSLTAAELGAVALDGYQASGVILDKALGTISVTYQPVVAAQWDITFTRTSTTEATAAVTSKGAAVEGISATIAYAGATELQNQNETANNKGILCINRNTTSATEADPNAYTLTITNNSNTIYTFDYAAVAGVALNSTGAFQPLSTGRSRKFKVTLGETVLPEETLVICDNNHCNGTETSHAYAQAITLAPGASYTINVAIYTDGGDGCYYGLTRIAMGSTNVSIGSTGYTTLYTPIAMTVPAVEGVSFYKGAFNADACELTLTAIAAGTNIPHETAVIIEGALDSQFSYRTAARNSAAVSGNELKGTHSALAIATVNAGNNEAYTLQPYDNEEGVAFLRYSGEKLAAGKIYLMLPKSLATQQQAVRVRKFGTPTEMESAVRDAQGSQLIYDLQGRRVLNPTKGMYIVNGKKVVVK